MPFEEVAVMNAINPGGMHDVRAAAKEDHESVIELTRDLVALPSRAALTLMNRYSTGSGSG